MTKWYHLPHLISGVFIGGGMGLLGFGYLSGWLATMVSIAVVSGVVAFAHEAFDGRRTMEDEQ